MAYPNTSSTLPKELLSRLEDALSRGYRLVECSHEETDRAVVDREPIAQEKRETDRIVCTFTFDRVNAWRPDR